MVFSANEEMPLTKSNIFPCFHSEIRIEENFLHLVKDIYEKKKNLASYLMVKG